MHILYYIYYNIYIHLGLVVIYYRKIYYVVMFVYINKWIPGYGMTPGIFLAIIHPSGPSSHRRIGQVIYRQSTKKMEVIAKMDVKNYTIYSINISFLVIFLVNVASGESTK